MKTYTITYFTTRDMAVRLGIKPKTFGNWARRGQVPGPTHQLLGSRRLYYVEADEAKILEAIKRIQEPQILSKNAMAAACRVSAVVFAGMLADGTVPEPTHRYGCRLVYASSELPAIKAAIANRPSLLPRQRAGFLTRENMADQLRIDLSTLTGLIRRGILSRPTHRFGGRKHLFYIASDYAILKAQLKVHAARGRSMPAGYYSGITASAALGMPEITYRLYLKRGILPKPTRKPHGVGYKFFLYDEKDITHMRQILNQCGYYYRTRSAVLK